MENEVWHLVHANSSLRAGVLRKKFGLVLLEVRIMEMGYGVGAIWAVNWSSKVGLQNRRSPICAETSNLSHPWPTDLLPICQTVFVRSWGLQGHDSWYLISLIHGTQLPEVCWEASSWIRDSEILRQCHHRTIGTIWTIGTIGAPFFFAPAQIPWGPLVSWHSFGALTALRQLVQQEPRAW